MRVLAIETSCDETGAAVLEKNNEIKLLSNITATSLAIHATTGGIIPENAAREQVKFIIPTIIESLLASEKIETSSNPEKDLKNVQKILKETIDVIAVTYGPGLIGSLLVGVETAKTLSFVLNKPLIPVNHLLAHLFANFISTNHEFRTPNFPFIGLIVSGGHTDLLYFESVKRYTWLGGTRDDAAGEALDKIGRLLNLQYPAGPEIERRAKLVEKPTIKFQSPLLHSKDFDFSFSGLKTEVYRFVKAGEAITSQGGKSIPNRVWNRSSTSEDLTNQICYAVQKAIIDVLVSKTVKAAEKYKVQTIVLGGGVSANETLRNEFKLNAKHSQLNAQIFAPEKFLSTDNAAMIGAYALMDYKPVNWQEVEANPELYFA